jgi:hypothetical protein
MSAVPRVLLAFAIGLCGCTYIDTHVADTTGQNRSDAANTADMIECSHTVGTSPLYDTSTPRGLRMYYAVQQRMEECMKAHGWIIVQAHWVWGLHPKHQDITGQEN